MVEKKTTKMQKAGKVAKGGLALAALAGATFLQPELAVLTVPAMIGIVGFGGKKEKK